jgi:peroxiredoxin
MGGKTFSVCLSVLFLFLLLPFDFPAEGREEDLYSKVRISLIKGDKKAPDFSLLDLHGKKVGLKQFRGKIILLNFWATWCGPCKEEMPFLEILHQQFKEKDFVVVTVSVDYEEAKLVREFVNKQRYTFPVLLDPKCEVLDLFEVKGIPTTFIIDKKGKMLGMAIGPRDWKCQEAISLISVLIGK